ncbi:MAG: glucose-1-phosphate adenylyltransferase subunit GlgD, partial [Clostridia bacterium]|nr:glucose-1-phosphate adenylyltransferase subunit GlgD [Clostridia bacterium]
MRRNDTMGIILTREDNIPPITDIRAIDALPIAGRYRIIDFIISCMVNAGIQNIGIATTYNYFSLMEHLRVGEPWDLDRKNWGLRVLPPNVEKKGMSKPKGTVDVLDGIRDYISSSTQTYVVLSFGSGIYNIDLSEAVEDHINKQADVTMIYKDKSNDEITENDLSRFTLLEMDENEKITDIAIEPFYPNSSIVFMEMLIMEKALLESIIDECTSRGETDFMKDAIVKRISSLRIFGHKYEGAAKKIDSMKSYFDAGMSFLCDDFRKAIFNNERPIQTRSTAQSP